MEGSIVGRDEELAAISEFLAARELLPARLTLVGEPGIGKTSLWKRGVWIAREAGYRVLASAPTVGESWLAHAVLGDLLEGSLEQTLPKLPLPQRRAVEVALLLADAGDEEIDRRALGLALLGSLRVLGVAGPVLVAVDDQQWSDSASVAALEFALRRLQHEPVGLLVSRRPGEPDAVERSLRGSWIEVGPLSLGAMHRLVKERLGVSFSRPVARRLWQTSGGNPFYGLELARELRSEYRGSALDGELPVPRDLRQLVARRVGVLPAETVTALCAASLLAEPTWGLVSAAIGRDASRVMQPAVRAEMVEPGGERVRFNHPLYAAAVSAQLTGEEGRELHRRLAELVVDPAKRARHLAFAAAGPDETVALAIEHAAAGVQAQGAPAPAVELLERALQLTPLPEVAASRRRRLALATAYDKLGDRERARAILGELSSELPPGNERAAVLVRLGWANPDVGEAIDLYDQALEEADPHGALAGEIHLRLAEWQDFRGDHLGLCRRHLRRAVEELEGARSPLLANAIAERVFADALAGEPPSEVLIERALELEASAGGPRDFFSPTAMIGALRLLDGRLEQARAAFETIRERAGKRGDDFVRASALRHLVQVEARAGRLTSANRYIVELTALDDESGSGVFRGFLASSTALVETYRGRVSEAREAAAEYVALRAAAGDRLQQVSTWTLLGLLELSLGDAQTAWNLLDPLVEPLDAQGYRDPARPPLLHNAIEAAIGIGELARAEELLARLEPRAVRRRTPWGIALAARCRGLVAAGQGDLVAAAVSLERALAEPVHAGEPVEHGRTLLALGRVRRRAGQRRAARESLEESLAVFDGAEAALWAGQAREELGRIGGRAPSRGDLTPTERRIATLVANGHTNREVAATLFVTVKTVEAALTRVYRKLDVRSRTELARRLAATPKA